MTLRERTPTSRPSSITGTRSRSSLLEEAERVVERQLRVEREAAARRSRRPASSRGSRPGGDDVADERLARDDADEAARPRRRGRRAPPAATAAPPPPAPASRRSSVRGSATIASRTRSLTGRCREPQSAPATSRIPATSAALRSESPCSLREAPDAVERVVELVGELGADLVAVPEEAAEVLHPLEVRDGDAARVREDVGQDGDAPLGEDRVAPRASVGPFAPSATMRAWIAAGVVARGPGPRARRGRGCRTAARAAPRS